MLRNTIFIMNCLLDKYKNTSLVVKIIKNQIKRNDEGKITFAKTKTHGSVAPEQLMFKYLHASLALKDGWINFGDTLLKE